MLYWRKSQANLKQWAKSINNKRRKEEKTFETKMEKCLKSKNHVKYLEELWENGLMA